MKFKKTVIAVLIILTNSQIIIAQKNQYVDFGFHILKNKNRVDIPFQLLSNLIVIPVKINESDTLNFILDSGVSNIIITDPTLAVKLNLKKTRKVKIAGVGEGGEIQANISPNNIIKIGNILAKNQNLVILENDFLEISQILGQRIHGIIGYDLFNYFVINIDFGTNYVHFFKPEKYKYRASKGDFLPIEIEETKPYLNDVKIEINSKIMQARLMIDTGAGHAVSLELENEDTLLLPKKLLKSQLGKGLSGTINGFLGRTNKISFGNFEMQDIISSFPDSESVTKKLTKEIARNGNIGCEILKRFNVTFNYREKYILLKPLQSKFKEPFEHNMSGIEFIAKGNNYREIFIDRVIYDSPGYLAGFREGDQIIAINNVNYINETLSNIYKILQKKEGRVISLIVRRGREYIQSEFKLKRQI